MYNHQVDQLTRLRPKLVEILEQVQTSLDVDLDTLNEDQIDRMFQLMEAALHVRETISEYDNLKGMTHDCR